MVTVQSVHMVCTSGGGYATQLDGGKLDLSGASEGGGSSVDLNSKNGGSLWDED